MVQYSTKVQLYTKCHVIALCHKDLGCDILKMIYIILSVKNDSSTVQQSGQVQKRKVLHTTGLTQLCVQLCNHLCNQLWPTVNHMWTTEQNIDTYSWLSSQQCNWHGCVPIFLHRECDTTLVCTAFIASLIWSSLVWYSLDWSGLVWSGMVWSILIWSSLKWFRLVWSSLYTGDLELLWYNDTVLTNPSHQMLS